MPCFHPLKGYRSRTVNPSGKRSIVYNPNDGFTDLPVQIPCGQCVGCRLEHSRQWAVRCVHESKCHSANSFITLTFSDNYVYGSKSLVKSDFQKFMKRLRSRIPYPIRYFHCGEYGELLQRPHHHAIIFGYDFPDRKHFTTRGGNPLYISQELAMLWPFGFSSIGEVNFETCAYVARYTLKKKTGPAAEDFYKDLQPPYNTMSLKPGIGKPWYDRFSSDVFPNDRLIIRNGIKCKPPKYYDSIYDLQNPDSMLQIKKRRYKGALKHKENNTPERLQTREECCLIKTNELKRNYDEK